MRQRLGTHVGDDDTLAGGEPIVLDHERCTELVEGLHHLVDPRAGTGTGCRDTGGGHDLLGKRLAALESRSLSSGAERRNSLGTHRIHGTSDKRRFRADDDQVDALCHGERSHRVGVGATPSQRETRGHGLHAGVTRSDDHLLDRRVAGEGESQSMFASAATDDEDLHGPQPRCYVPGGVPGPLRPVTSVEAPSPRWLYGFCCLTTELRAA